MRWLGNVVAFLIVVGLVAPADAQVFKPKGKKSDVVEKKPKAKKKKAQKKKVSTKSKKAAAERSRPEDLTPEPASKSDDEDFVKITDDDDIE